MANTAVASPKPPESKPSLTDVNARDNFISVALREIISDQLAKGKWNHEQAAVLAVRYANAVMAARGTETAPLKVVVTKGTIMPATPSDVPIAGVSTEEKPATKSIAEIIGEAEPVAEVK